MVRSKAFVRVVVAGAVLALTAPGVADVPATFPTSYAIRQKLATTLTVVRGDRSFAVSRTLRAEGAIVLDSASALHFEPAYPGGYADGTVSQTGRRTMEFRYSSEAVGFIN